MIEWALFGSSVRWGNAIEFMALLIAHLKTIGYHAGLTGSVIMRGRSKKDIDVIIYPLDTSKTVTYEALHDHLVLFGLKKIYNRETVQKRWRALGSKDTKHVEVWANATHQRIDFFFL